MKGGDEAGALGGRGGHGDLQRARGADGGLDDVGEVPHAGYVGYVVRTARCRRVCDFRLQILNPDVGVGGCGRESEDHGEEGVLEEYGLP